MKIKQLASAALSCAVILGVPGAPAYEAAAGVMSPGAAALVRTLPHIQANPATCNSDVERVLGHLSLDLALGRGESVARQILGSVPAQRYVEMSAENQVGVLAHTLARLRKDLVPEAQELLAAYNGGQGTLNPRQTRRFLEINARFYLLPEGEENLAAEFHRAAANIQWDRNDKELRAIATDALNFPRAGDLQATIEAARLGILEGAGHISRAITADRSSWALARPRMMGYAEHAFQAAVRRLEERDINGGLLSVAVLKKHDERMPSEHGFSESLAIAAIEHLPNHDQREGEAVPRTAAPFAAPLGKLPAFTKTLIPEGHRLYRLFGTLADLLGERFGAPDAPRAITLPWYARGFKYWQTHVSYFDHNQDGAASPLEFYGRMRFFKRNLLIDNPLTAAVVTLFFSGLVSHFTSGWLLNFDIVVPMAKRIRQTVHHSFWSGPEGGRINKGRLDEIASQKGYITPIDVLLSMRVDRPNPWRVLEVLRYVLEWGVGVPKVALEWVLQFLIMWQPQLLRPKTWFVPIMTAAELESFKKGELWYQMANETLRRRLRP